MARRPLTIRWLIVLIGFVILSSLIMVTGCQLLPAIRRAVPRLVVVVAAIGGLVPSASRLAEGRATDHLPPGSADAPNGPLVITLDTERAPGAAPPAPHSPPLDSALHPADQREGGAVYSDLLERWAYAAAYLTSLARARMLPKWLRCYNQSARIPR